MSLKFRKSYVVLLIFTLYGVNHYIFERFLYFNELLSLIGFYYFIKCSFRSKGKVYWPQSPIYRAVVALIALLLIYALGSCFVKTNWYYYFRNSSIIYSIFSFFVGFHLYHRQYWFFNRIRKWLYLYAIGSFAIGSTILVDRNAFAAWLAIMQRNFGMFSWLLLVLLFAIYTLTFGSITVLIALFVVLFFALVSSYRFFKVSMLFALLSFVLLFIVTVNDLELYRLGTNSLFGNVHLVYNQHAFYDLDHNSSWRLLLWYRLLIEGFPQNLIGIGIGTPILPYFQNVTSTELGHTDEYIAHVIGAHNTFITMFSRFGIGFLILITKIYHTIFKEFFFHKSYYMNSRNDFSLFLAFFIVTTVGLFNLLLETPTLASLYWVILGFVAAGIHNRKVNHNEV